MPSLCRCRGSGTLELIDCPPSVETLGFGMSALRASVCRAAYCKLKTPRNFPSCCSHAGMDPASEQVSRSGLDGPGSRRSEFPQGLKPGNHAAHCGTTEVAP